MKVNKVEYSMYTKEDGTVGIKKKLLTPIPQKTENLETKEIAVSLKMETFERDLNDGEIIAKNVWDKKENINCILNFDFGFTQHELEQPTEIFSKMFYEAVDAMRFVALIQNEYYRTNKTKK